MSALPEVFTNDFPTRDATRHRMHISQQLLTELWESNGWCVLVGNDVPSRLAFFQSVREEDWYATFALAPQGTP